MQTKPTSFQEILADYASQIDAGIADYFKSGQSHLGLRLDEQELAAFERLREFSGRSGKRLRGALAMFAYDSFSKDSKPSAVKLGVAIELIQNYLLIIDDVMDSSDSRRGAPSIHKIFSTDHGVNNHLASMMAIQVALITQHMAANLLGQVDEHPAHIRRALAVFHQNIAATCYGQFDDLLNTSVDQFDEARLIRLYELKNSYYTFINPLQVGSLLAGNEDQAILDHLAAIGRPAGIAFQIHDDILGMFGEQEVTGKPSMDDLREGKRTLLMRYGYENATADQLEKIKAALGNDELSPTMHQEVKAILQKSGARAAAEKKAQDFCTKAQNELNSADFFDSAAKRFLSDVINFVVHRKA